MILDLGYRCLLNVNRYLRIGDTIRMPGSMTAVTTINHVDEVDPAIVGMTVDGVESIWRSVEDIYRTGTHPGISLCFRRQGKIILHRSIGHARGNGPRSPRDGAKVLMQPDTPVCYFSGAKAVTAFLIHLLNEDKLIDLHDTIGFYFPEFGRHGKKNINIHQVLSHRSGIPGLPKSLPIELLSDNDEIWRLLCGAKMPSRHKGNIAYHALTGGYILERIINKVTNMDIQQFLDERVRKPMNMKYFRYGLTPEHATRIAANYTTGLKPMFPVSSLLKGALGGPIKLVTEVSNTARFNNAVIPAGNLMGTAEEMSRFFQMLLNDGVWQGKQICQPMTVRHLTQEYCDVQFDRTLMLPMRYSAGLMIGGDPFGLWGRHSSSAFGHIGLTNKLFWADRERDISVSLLTTGMPVIANNIPPLINFLASINRHCPRDNTD